MTTGARSALLLLAAVALALGGCSSTSSPKTQLLHRMHETVPNVPSDAITLDADDVCNRGAAARQFLLDDSMAEMEGVDGLELDSAALRQYVDRLIKTVHSVRYCS